MILWLSMSALAQAPGDGLPAIDADPLRVVVDSHDALSVEHTELVPGITAGLHGRFTNSLLVVHRNGNTTELLGAAGGVQASAAWSGQHLRVGATVPMVLHASGDRAPEGVTALGDVSLDLKVGGWAPTSGPLRIAGALRVGVPTGGSDALVGSGSLWTEPVLVAGAHTNRVRTHVNLGAHVQRPTELGRDTVGTSLVYRGAVAADPSDRWTATVEAWGRSRFSGTNTHPLEGLATLRWHGATLGGYVGGGAGLLPGVGAPRWRALAGITVHAPQSTTETP